jgi:hypothetical protein
VLAGWFRSKGFRGLSGFDAPGWLVYYPNMFRLAVNDIHFLGHFLFPPTPLLHGGQQARHSNAQREMLEG